MIYRQSTDPVFLKKINIDIWSLRDQIEQIVLARLKDDPNNLNFEDIIKEFSSKKKPNLRLLKFEDDNQKESKKKDSDAKEDENQNPEPHKKDAIAEEDNTESKSEKEIITQRIPKLSEEKICKGKTFLSEIYMDQMLFFSDRQYVEGQSIVIQFNVPEKFILNAEVIYCQPFSLKNRIISSSNLPYRVCANFTFLRLGERTLLRRFLENIEYRHNTSEPDDDQNQETDDSDNTTAGEKLAQDSPEEQEAIEKDNKESNESSDE